MSSVYIEYVGKRIGSFTLTAHDKRMYRISKHQPLIPIDERDLSFFAGRSDFVVPRATTRGGHISGVRVGPTAIKESPPEPSRRITRPRDERGTKKVYP